MLAGIHTGAFRSDANADDIVALLQGAFFATTSDDGPERVARLLNLIVDALLVSGPTNLVPEASGPLPISPGGAGSR